MQNRDTLKNILIAGAVFVLAMSLVSRIVPPLPKPGSTGTARTTAGTTPATPPSGVPRAQPAGTPDAGTATVAPSNQAPDTHGFTVNEAAELHSPVMGSAEVTDIAQLAEESPYRMRLELSNVGASVETATITDHAEAVKSAERYRLLEPVERADGTRVGSLAIEQINLDGIDLPLGDKRWHADSISETAEGQIARFWVEVQKDATTVLKLTRTFTLPKQTEKSGHHDFESLLTIENLSAIPHEIVVTYRGGIGVRRISPRMDDRYVDWGISDGTRVTGTRKLATQVDRHPEEPSKLFSPSTENPDARLSWAATANTYFTCTVAPLDRAGHDNPNTLSEVSVVDLDRDALTTNDVTVRFVSRGQQVAGGARLLFPTQVYVGAKDLNALRDLAPYNHRNYYSQISMGYGKCTFTWLVELMIVLLNGLVVVTHDYGIAIIVMVLMVRTLLHPITKKGQVNMVKMQHRMQEVAPKIEEIKKKFANDKARMNQEMMKLNINPAGQILTCLPMFIQMPIWVALYLSLSSNIGIRHEPLHFTWVHDLTAVDALYTFAHPITVPFVGWVLPTLNLLPLLLAVFMYLQQKTQPRPAPNPNATEQQVQQQQMMQKMMPLMSIMMLLFFYKAPSGLNLYIMFSSMFGMIEQHRIRAHIKEREADGTLHKAPEKPRTDEKLGKKGPEKMGFFQRLQKMADDAQKAQPKRPPKRKPR